MTPKANVKNTKGVSKMYYIAKVNQKGVYSYLMTDGVFRPRPAYCQSKTKYDKVRAKSWLTFLWSTEYESTAKLVIKTLTGKRLKNKPFLTNGVTH